MKLRDIDPIDVLVWAVVLCAAAYMIGQTVRAIMYGEPPP